MFSTDDTIVAIATPPGRGGIGIVRLSGPDAHEVARALCGRSHPFSPRRATLTRIVDPERENDHGAIDEVVATFFAAPDSYTRQDVVEVSAHGSPVLLERIVQLAVDAGARLAEPGEFTLRAYLSGRVDLVQAEAVADLVNAVTPAQARLAFDQLDGTLTGAIADVERQLFELVARLEASLDFPEEGYHFAEAGEVAAGIGAITQRLDAMLAGAARGRVFREGRQIVILGRPNAGKSTLFNRLVGFDRAITTEVAGTTRDLLTERADLGGVPVTFVDTAGLRYTSDPVEHEGVRRAKGAALTADLALVVLDVSSALTADDRDVLEEAAARRAVVALNKADRPPAWGADALDAGDAPLVAVSARTGAGIDSLRQVMLAALGSGDPARDTIAITNLRHITLVEKARAAVGRAREGALARASEEFLLADLREAIDALQEVTGRRAPDAVLEEIFRRFCIGK
jgi:tRNA modification GTPase